MNDFLNYLKPVDFLQSSFFILILCIPIVIIILVHLYANEKNWKKNWDCGTECKEDDLDIEHGSITDLAEIVATKAERVADILPGFMLILGLLGTFIGLGLALDKAGGIVTSTDADVINKGMNEMISNLGLNFKTSIYGILGFLLFKIYYSSYGREQDRIKWCIKQTKRQLDNDRLEIRNIQARRHNEYITCFTNLESTISQKIQGMQQQSSELLKENIKKTEELKKTFESTSNELSKILEDGFKQVTESSVGIPPAVEKLKGIISVIGPQITTSADKLFEAANTVSSSSKEMSISIGKFGPTVSSTLESIKEGFIKHITNSTDKLDSATKSIKDAINLLAKTSSDEYRELKSLIDNLKQSITESDKKMQYIQTMIQDATGSLSTVALSNEKTLGDLGKSIAEQLKSISASNREMSKVNRDLDAKTTTVINILNKYVETTGGKSTGIQTAIDSLHSFVKKEGVTTGSLNEILEKKFHLIGSGFDEMTKIHSNLEKKASNILDTINNIAQTLNSFPVERVN